MACSLYVLCMSLESCLCFIVEQLTLLILICISWKGGAGGSASEFVLRVGNTLRFNHYASIDALSKRVELSLRRNFFMYKKDESVRQ